MTTQAGYIADKFGLNSAHARARASDPSTSHTAAAQSGELALKHAGKILDCLRDHGPLGKDGIARLTGIDGVAVARRLPELQREGMVCITGKKVQSATGRPEREWCFASA